MDKERFARLTERQKACLRQVSQLRVACEIATELNTSEAMVNKLIKEACEKIGVNRRKEAARLFAEFESRQGVPKLDVHFGDLAPPQLAADYGASPGDRVVTLVKEARPSFEADLDRASPPAPPPTGETSTQDGMAHEKARAGLELSYRITAIFAMICLAALLLSSLARTLESLLHLQPR